MQAISLVWVHSLFWVHPLLQSLLLIPTLLSAQAYLPRALACTAVSAPVRSSARSSFISFDKK